MTNYSELYALDEALDYLNETSYIDTVQLESFIDEVNQFNILCEMYIVESDENKLIDKIKNIIGIIIDKIKKIINEIKERIKKFGRDGKNSIINKHYKELVKQKLEKLKNNDIDTFEPDKFEPEKFKESALLEDASRPSLQKYLEDEIGTVEFYILGNLVFDLSDNVRNIVQSNIKVNSRIMTVDEFIDKEFKPQKFSIIEYLNLYGHESVWFEKIDNSILRLEDRIKELENAKNKISDNKDPEVILRRVISPDNISEVTKMTDEEGLGLNRVISILTSTLASSNKLIQKAVSIDNRYHSITDLFKRTLYRYAIKYVTDEKVLKEVEKVNITDNKELYNLLK